MPCCVAVGCSNSSRKGFRLFRFPSDAKRRAVWAAKVRRANWEPKESSRLCESHFHGRDFERDRIDGRKLLKKTAIPELFMCRPTPRLRSSPKKQHQPGNVQNQEQQPHDCRSLLEEHSYSMNQTNGTLDVTATGKVIKQQQKTGGGIETEVPLSLLQKRIDGPQIPVTHATIASGQPDASSTMQAGPSSTGMAFLSSNGTEEETPFQGCIHTEGMSPSLEHMETPRAQCSGTPICRRRRVPAHMASQLVRINMNLLQEMRALRHEQCGIRNSLEGINQTLKQIAEKLRTT